MNIKGATPSTELFADKDALCAAVAEKFLRLLSETVEAEGEVHAALTGGGAGIGTLEAAARLIREDKAQEPDWQRVHLWWGDERLITEGDPERNDQQACDALLDFLVDQRGLPQTNIHSMPVSEDAADPMVGARIYAEKLAAFADRTVGDLGLPKFALVLLGVGPDGHIASLFPGKDSLRVSGVSTVGEPDSPKPPPPRVSLTFDAIQSAERVWTVVTGSDKAEAVSKTFNDEIELAQIPAKGARGRNETVWHLDEASASGLP